MAALKLEDYIKQLQDPVPEFQDPEDAGDETAARLAPRATDDGDVQALQPTALRRRAATFGDIKGKVTSRKELYGDFSEEEDESGIDSDKEQASEDDEEGDEMLTKEAEDGMSNDDEEEEELLNEDEEQEDEVSLNDQEQEEEDEEDKESSSDEEEEKEVSFNKDEEEEMSEEEEEGMGALSDDDNDDGDFQSGESEEEGDGDVGGDSNDDEITSEEDEDGDASIIQKDDTVRDETEKAQAVVHQLDLWDRLMEVRIQLQRTLSLVNKLPTPGTAQSSIQFTAAKDVLQDVGCSLYDIHCGQSSPRKRKSDDDIDELAQQSYDDLLPVRNNSLTFWDEKTRLASKKFKSFKSYQTPVLKQVEQILGDRDRLVRRTQVNRDADAADQTDEPEEIFDDNDFYQRLLKSLIESKASDESVMSSSASQWLEAQKLRGKKKKKKDIDTRASKGRKLRYNVHNKLVNFMVPRDDSTWSENAKNELFKNLFKMPGLPER